MKETPKQKAIREAWEAAGFLWDEINKLVKENGSMILPGVDFKNTLTGYKEAGEKKLLHAIALTNDGLWLNLKAIRNIDFNNGWIRTDERLPEEKGEYWVVVKDVGEIAMEHFEPVMISYWQKFTSHWQPIYMPEPPIY